MMKQNQQRLLSLVFLVAVATAVVAADPQPQQAGMSSEARSLLQPSKPDCPSKCFARCGKSWKNEMCLKMCNICCGKCSCVPPGTGQETRNQCPCYATMKNPKTGKLKCP